MAFWAKCCQLHSAAGHMLFDCSGVLDAALWVGWLASYHSTTQSYHNLTTKQKKAGILCMTCV